MLMSIFCNALFASFRSEYQILSDPTDAIQLREGFARAMSEAKRVYWLEMNIADLTSFVLFGIGLILSGIAFWKGYTIDDRFPGYGRLDRKRKAARIVEIDRQNILRQKIKDYLVGCRGHINAALNEPGQLIQRATSQTAELSGAKATLKNQAGAIQRDHKLVLDSYRQGNTAIRATDPPLYFSRFENIQDRVTGEAADAILDDFKLLNKEICETRDRIQKPLSAKLQTLQHDSANVLNSVFGQFVLDVESDAKEELDRSVITISRLSPQ